MILVCVYNHIQHKMAFLKKSVSVMCEVYSVKVMEKWGHPTEVGSYLPSSAHSKVNPFWVEAEFYLYGLNLSLSLFFFFPLSYSLCLLPLPFLLFLYIHELVFHRWIKNLIHFVIYINSRLFHSCIDRKFRQRIV